ncbi:diacylglycerol/lipid kinase family protein [Alkalibacterium pelagium]|uniref:Lipid kinase, YegS/Rv2252/BmrU family n=1 Tax=Alkalibacterium pelagium TaxID=426702 RepID=A0A1H7G385_9LACT|nr:diacylglycerol kinase family protein [Alkalibacterium pelagium]GEN49940.1 diacylglycerol kinase [Alkalibacterium pelagium]SEK31977.1 lipid kinase, YegS/Rv2252/BmrU family [Alkalibacterium pelagium]
MNDIMIIANPSAGKKQAEEYAKKARDVLGKQNREAQIRLTEKKEDISNLAIEAACKQYKSIIVLGGDGTVSELANGLIDQDYKPSIGIIPSGTVNNIARGLNISVNPEEAVRDLTACREQKADVGKINGQLFLSSISAGSLPETVWEVSDDQKERYGTAAYFIEGIRTLREEECYDFEMEVDGVSHNKKLSLLLIGASHSVMGIPQFFNDAGVDDGHLYMLGVEESTISEKLSIFSQLLSRKSTLNESQEKAFVLPFKQAEIKTDHPDVHVAIDGEKGPSFPAHVEVLPGFLTFLVPSEKG